MNLKEFKNIMNQAQEELIDNYGSTTLYFGVCPCLWLLLGEDCRRDFIRLFRPSNRTENSYWAGDPIEKNLGKRQILLRLFEQVAIEHKLYKNY